MNPKLNALDPMPMSFGPAIREPKPLSAAEQKVLAEASFEQGDHTPAHMKPRWSYHSTLKLKDNFWVTNPYVVDAEWASCSSGGWDSAASQNFQKPVVVDTSYVDTSKLDVSEGAVHRYPCHWHMASFEMPAKTEAKQTTDGWIEHDGKGQPVGDDTQVQVKFRSGEEDLEPTAAFIFDWENWGDFADIVAYKVVDELESWLKHDGGPYPFVGKNPEVQVKFRNGDSVTVHAAELRWNLIDGEEDEYDIVAYKVL